MGLIAEFKQFALRGNVVDMAVGIITGAAFQKIVSSLVENIITPPIGLLIGGVDFKKLEIALPTKALEEAAKVAGQTVEIAPVTIKYGLFLQACFDFVIIAFVLFMILRFMNQMIAKRDAAPATPPPPTKDQELLTEIRDLLKQQA